jgi:hypothetical protein
VPNDGGVSEKLVGAKKALAAANNSNVATRSGNPFSSASYSMVRQPQPRPQSSLADEAKSAGEGIKARMESEAAARKSIQ